MIEKKAGIEIVREIDHKAVPALADFVASILSAHPTVLAPALSSARHALALLDEQLRRANRQRSRGRARHRIQPRFGSRGIAVGVRRSDVIENRSALIP